MRVLREHAIFATNADAVVPTHGTTQRIAYGSPNHIASANVGAFLAANDVTDSAACANAHYRPNLITDGHTDSNSITSADASAFPGADGAADIFADSRADGRTNNGADDPPDASSNDRCAD